MPRLLGCGKKDRATTALQRPANKYCVTEALNRTARLDVGEHHCKWIEAAAVLRHESRQRMLN